MLDLALEPLLLALQAPEEKLDPGIPVLLVCPDCARRSTKREVGKLDSRSSAIRPSVRHAPLNSSISAISDRISGVMRNFSRSRAVIHSPIRFHPNGMDDGGQKSEREARPMGEAPRASVGGGAEQISWSLRRTWLVTAIGGTRRGDNRRQTSERPSGR